MFIGKTLETKHQDEVAETTITDYVPLSEWELLQLAIIKTESDFDANAVGKTKDLGCMQITPIYVAEINRLCDTTIFYHLDAFDVSKTLDMYDIYQSAKNPEHNIHKAISLHNPNGDTIGYASRVLNNYRYLERIEYYRKLIVQRNQLKH